MGSSVAEWLACWTQAQYRAWVQIAAVTLSGNRLRQTVHTHHASVHQAAKLVAVLLRVVMVTAGLAESNGSLLPGLWLTSPAGWLPRTGISSGTLRSVIQYGLPLPWVWTFHTYACRYFELVSEVGELEPLRDIHLGPPKSALLNVFFEEQSWSHRFKLDSKVADIKRLLSQKFVGLPTSAFTVLFKNAESHCGAEFMKYPLRTLLSYGARDNDELYVRLTTRRTWTSWAKNFEVFCRGLQRILAALSKCAPI